MITTQIRCNGYLCISITIYNLGVLKQLISDAPYVERPIAGGIACRALMGDKLFMIPLMPVHRDLLHSALFSQPIMMQYFGTGRTFSLKEYSVLNEKRSYSNLNNYPTTFTWVAVTSDGIAGRFNICPSEERVELTICVVPSQSGRNLAVRASNLIVEHLGEETSFIATAHPSNIPSRKTLDKIQYSNGKYVFFPDPTRQKEEKYGQIRQFYLSK